jgi:Uma2 family endonuclease
MSGHTNPEKDYYTYGDYKLWPDEERWEIIDGEAYDMSPAPGLTHQKISGEIYRQIANFLEGKPCRVFAAPFDVFLPEPGESEDGTSTVVQPDISIICDDSKLSEKGCTGPPEVIIEIVSPWGASRDQIKKRRLYEKKGVGEYWIVHPSDRIVWKYVLSKGSYGKPDIFDNTGKPSFEIFPEFKLDLLKVFGPSEEVKMPSPAKYRAQNRGITP